MQGKKKINHLLLASDGTGSQAFILLDFQIKVPKNKEAGLCCTWKLTAAKHRNAWMSERRSTSLSFISPHLQLLKLQTVCRNSSTSISGKAWRRRDNIKNIWWTTRTSSRSRSRSSWICPTVHLPPWHLLGLITDLASSRHLHHHHHHPVIPLYNVCCWPASLLWPLTS